MTERSARSRKASQLVLQAIARVGQVHIASELGCDEATVSRIKNDRLDQALDLIIASGCKVVPAELQCYDPKYFESIYYLAQKQIQSAPPQSLQWDDE